MYLQAIKWKFSFQQNAQHINLAPLEHYIALTVSKLVQAQMIIICISLGVTHGEQQQKVMGNSVANYTIENLPIFAGQCPQSW